ncbi:hypothetical protein E3N88_20753 [Mikania micrantha]|uniref:Peptidase S10 serine carboxypeptidase n=1 Tax=Mikania micrantha TaxID=192012 RepID=A0A5N6NJL3_9ASTR|nr:hypothetical protein E3N88_20753 [Mikania micrantha]
MGEDYNEILQDVTAELYSNYYISNLNKLIKSRSAGNPLHAESWTKQDISNLSPAYIIPQEGSMEADKIDKLPGQPEADFDHYAGYDRDARPLDMEPWKNLDLFGSTVMGKHYIGMTMHGIMVKVMQATMYLSLLPLFSQRTRKRNKTVINLKGIAIGNAWIDDTTSTEGIYDYYWTHALNSDETNAGINKYCDYISGNFSDTCEEYQSQGDNEYGEIDIYNIYAPLCDVGAQKPGSPGSVKDFDPCSDDYVSNYLNRAEVQEALHARNTSWSFCGGIGWTDSPTTILPTINQLIADGIIVWIYSGDIDGRVPVTSSRYSVNKLKIPVVVPWRPWYYNKEVGGYVVGYRGSMVLTTIRGAGHTVPSYQPERALVMISSFLQGELPPSLM